LGAGGPPQPSQHQGENALYWLQLTRQHLLQHQQWRMGQAEACPAASDHTPMLTRATARIFFMASYIGCEAEAHGSATILMDRARQIFQAKSTRRKIPATAVNRNFAICDRGPEAHKMQIERIRKRKKSFAG